MFVPSTIVAVVVTHQPDLLRLAMQLASLQRQVQAIVLVDNGSNLDVRASVPPSAGCPVHVLALGKNLGIACAQNHGIAWARAQKASHVLFMDHDSQPAAHMVQTLLQALQQHPDAAAAGPWYADSRRHTESTPFVRIEGFRRRKLPCTVPNAVLSVDHLIASGCLIPVAVLDQVGLMREDFFIDFVDVEWCLRARHAGYQIYGVCAAHLEHSLGENPIRFLGREYLSHSPWRHYFHVRNALLLYREPWVPLSWKVVSAWRLVLKAGFHVLVTAPRLQHLRQMAHGALHGLSGHAGGHPSTGRTLDISNP